MSRYISKRRKLYVDSFCKLLAFPSIDIYEMKKDKLMEILVYLKVTSFDFTDIYLRSLAEARDIASFDKDMQRIEF